jgi:hypothetical protein
MQLRNLGDIKMQHYNIDTCAMLVEVNASVWTARKLDRATTDEVIIRKNAASKGAARVNKHLLAGRPELEVIVAHVGGVRGYVYENTLPWSDSGLRLLPVVKFQEFNTRMKVDEDKYWELCKSFVDIYPSLITAQALQLGDMFKREDFPSADTILHKFGFQVSYMPVPTAGDFRVDIGNDAQAELKAQLDKLADDRVKSAMDDIKGKLRNHLFHMSNRLAVDVVDNVPKVRGFHDSLLDYGHDLCDLVKTLNLTQDVELEDARAAFERCLNGITTRTNKRGREVSVADTLREDMGKRSAVKAQVDEILNKFTW